MAPRWIGLVRAPARAACKHRSFREGARALSVAGFLMAAAGLNFAMHPQALAQVIGSDVIQSFAPAEPSMGPSVAPIVVDEAEVRLLAATTWGEARSEGEDGMRAVAHVMVNRVGDRFGSDLTRVIRAPKQFSAWNLGDPNRPLVQNPERYATGGVALETWETAQRVAREVLCGQSIDPTHGALFYHTRAIRPWWSRYGQGRQEIGAHVFYADVPDRSARRAPRVTQVADTTPRLIDPPVTLERGPRAGRVNGVIQYAPPNAAGQALPSEAGAAIEPADVNAAATPTVNGVPVTASR
jgi:spore germination cell wall hydrolase CwlJ-like protein